MKKVELCGCLICGKSDIRCLHLHLKNCHKITLDEYLQQFPDAEVSSPMYNEKNKRNKSISMMGDKNIAKRPGVGKKISERNKGRKVSVQQRKKTGATIRQQYKNGRVAYWTGKKRSKSTRKKISVAHKGKIIPIETRRRISETEKEQFRSGERKHPWTGKPSWNVGIPMRKESRDKVRASVLENYKKHPELIVLLSEIQKSKWMG